MLPQEKVQNLIDRHRKLESDLSSGAIDGHTGIRVYGHTGTRKICNQNFSFLFRLTQREEGNNTNTRDLDT